MVSGNAMRIQRVALEHYRHFAVLARLVVYQLVLEEDVAARYVLQPGYHSQRGGFAAARRAYDDNKFLFVYVEVKVVNCLFAVRIDFFDVSERKKWSFGIHCEYSSCLRLYAGRRKTVDHFVLSDYKDNYYWNKREYAGSHSDTGSAPAASARIAGKRDGNRVPV